MTDSYFVQINDLDKDIKVGVPEVFTGKAGLEIDEIEFYVDGFNIGNAGFGRASPTERNWELTYTFNGAGKGRKLAAIAKANGETVCVCNRVFDVAAKIAERPIEPVGGIKPLKLVNSKIRHRVRWNDELVGIVYHYDAGRPSNDPTGLLNMGVKNGYSYWAMMVDGTVYKTHELNQFGAHVGMSRHRNHLGVEISGCGRLRERNGEYHPWYHWKDGVFIEGSQPWPKDQIRYFGGSATQVKGYYAKFSQAQEDAMVSLVQYVKSQCPKFKIENVVDHSECMAEMGWYGEKQDVGGSLSMSMPDFREYLKKVIV
jgi:hypothetical protein